jgi:hypothetical protein
MLETRGGNMGEELPPVKRPAFWPRPAGRGGIKHNFRHKGGKMALARGLDG